MFSSLTSQQLRKLFMILESGFFHVQDYYGKEPGYLVYDHLCILRDVKNEIDERSMRLNVNLRP